MNSSSKDKIASFAIVWCMVFSLFAGLLVVAPSEGAALPSFLENGDVVIGSDYDYSTWPTNPDLGGSTLYLNGNLTIRAGGTVTITNGALAFRQDIGYGDYDHIYTLVVEDGGVLNLNNAVLTTHLDTLYNYPSLGVLVQNGGSVVATDTTFQFPGQVVVDDSTFTMTDSVLTGHDYEMIDTYCNHTVFPASLFDDSAVFFAISSTCRFVNSRVEKIFEGQQSPGAYNHAYSFASDTEARDLVTYTVSRHASAFTAANTAVGPIANLTQDDLKYVQVSPGQVLSIGASALDGLVFPSSASYAITLNVKYQTDVGYDGVLNAISWNYENGASTPTTIVPTDTHASYNPAINIERTETYTMPSMSSADLKNVNISFTNGAGAAIYFNKIWYAITFDASTYGNLTFGGSSSFTAIDSYLDVDFSNITLRSEIHNQLNIVDQAKAYLYGVYGDVEEETNLAERDPAYVIDGIDESLFSINKNALDTSGGSLTSLRAVDGTYYTVATGTRLAIENFNVGDLSGSLTQATLSVTLNVIGGYAVGPYVQWGTSWGALKNTSIRPSSTSTLTFTFDLYANGIKDIATLNNLKISFINTGGTSVRFDRLTLDIQTGPSIYVYRWANVNAVDQQGLPISGAYVNASLLAGGAAAYYYTASGIQAVPPSDVLSYLGKNSSNYMMTNDSGAVKLPLLSEILNTTSQMPNMFALLGYALDIEYTNVSGILFSGSSTVSFQPYPAISQANQTQVVNFTMPSLYLDKPDLLIDTISMNLATIYLGDATMISVFMRNQALTGATNVVVNVTDSLSSWTSQKTVAFIGPGATVETTFAWTATPAGLHTITAKADPMDAIEEGSESNNERSLSVNVLANLPELSVVTGDISFSPQPAYSGSPVTTTVLVSNALGRANANNITVSFYIGDPTTSGQLIGTTIMNVTRGAANSTTFVWSPTDIGTYSIFVYINKERNPQEYSYTNNLASRSIIVDLSIIGTDLVVDDNDILTFNGADFNHRGRIIVMEQGTLIISGVRFTVDQDYDNQFQVYAMDNGRIVLDEATFTSTNVVWIYLSENAMLWVNDSSLADNVKIKMDGTSEMSITGSSVGAEIVAPTSSAATLTARDSSFTKSLSSFGGNSRANMIGISIPSMIAKEGSLIYHYRVIDVTIVDEANNAISGASVQLRWYVNGTVVENAVSGVNGKVSFDALCDMISLSGPIYYGTYVLNSSFLHMGTTYYADNKPVSLQPYSSPLAQVDPQVTVVLRGVIPISQWDLIVDDNDVVTLEGTTFTHRGRIIIMESGTLKVEDGGLAISQDSDFQYQIFVQDNGRLEISSASLTSNRNIWLYASGNSQVVITASMIFSSVRIDLADNAVLTIRNSTIGAGLTARTGSSAEVWAYNSTFQTAWSAFGGSAKAHLISVSVPTLRPLEGAVVYHYRWVEVLVVDGNNYALPGAVVQIRFYLNNTLFVSDTTKSNGKVLIAAICDVIDASSNNFLGNYRINATYWYSGQAYQTEIDLPVSLTPYTEPLIVSNKQVTASIPGALPNLDPPLTASNYNPYRGDNVTLYTSVTNSGVVDANNVLVRFRDGSSTISEIIIAKIVPGATADIQTIWVASYPLSQHNISVIVDPENAIKELNKNDNLNWTFVTVHGIVDLYVSATDVSVVPISPTTNSSAAITLTVHNSGDVAATNVNVSFVDMLPNSSQRLLGYRIIANVPALGGTGAATMTWIPNIWGSHNLVMRVNVGVPPVTEQVTGNNNITFPVTVLNYADLTPTSITYRPLTAIYVNNEVFIDVAVSNVGQTTASNVVVNYWEGTIGTGRMFDTRLVTSIAAGQTVVVTGTWNVLPGAGGKIQNRTITVDVNPSHTVTETNYNNNRLAQTVTVVDNRPDLVFVGGMTVTSGGVAVTEAVVGETVVLGVQVKNDGLTNALSVRIRFDAIDIDSFPTSIGTLSRDVEASQTIEVDLTWIVNVTSGNYTLRCTLDSVFLIDEFDEGNNTLSRDFRIDPPQPGITVFTTKSEYNPDETISITGKVTNVLTGDPLVNIKVVLALVNANTHAKVGDNTTVYTTTGGNYAGNRPVPSNVQAGYYSIESEVTVGNRTVKQYSAPFEVKAAAAETSLPFWIWILIIAVVLAVIIIFSLWLYRTQLGKMVECGECGALIPESSKRCPKCGVEFESGTAKCSQCGAWIPASSSECPECGAKFITEPLAEEESEHVRKMREQYDAYVNPYREQAKQVLGKKYSEAKFQEWWKRQPSYINFEKWLSQEEEKRKVVGTSFPCPVCGTPNPKGSNICNKCGTVFDKAMVAATEAASSAIEPSKPTRRIVRRPSDKKAIPKKEEEPAEQPVEQPAEQPKPEEPKSP